MSWELALRHLKLISAQLAGLEAYVADAARAESERQPRRATLALRRECAEVPEHKCGLRDEDAWQDRSTLAHPNHRTCVGCGYLDGSGTDVQ
jgi:hypothetical protein